MFGKDGYADAAGDNDALPTEIDRVRSCVQDLARDPLRILNLPHARENDQKFVSGESAYAVSRPNTRLDATCEDSKDLVTGGMSQLIVDLLEMVQVQKQQAQLLAMSFRAMNGLPDAIQNQ